jgi:hypothetical protein
MSAVWIGAGWPRRASDKLLGRLILILLVALGLILIAEGLFVAEPTRLVGTGLIPTAGCGPGHVAGETCELAIETQWGDGLGAVIPVGPTAVLAGAPRATCATDLRQAVARAPISTVPDLSGPNPAQRRIP